MLLIGNYTIHARTRSSHGHMTESGRSSAKLRYDSVCRALQLEVEDLRFVTNAVQLSRSNIQNADDKFMICGNPLLIRAVCFGQAERISSEQEIEVGKEDIIRARDREQEIEVGREEIIRARDRGGQRGRSSEQEIEVGREDIIRARDRGGQRGYHQSKR
ncbi:hypothetical protein RRG08_045219 [Elysia crispata]|uniref:Uncharacterized protein n=1 Tax=Elysia crispata TaxID=231223 RepID=A0AAE1DRY8_9GAST|nr:hypothetical protein RRG08_045219 [Elysia crispata]